MVKLRIENLFQRNLTKWLEDYKRDIECGYHHGDPGNIYYLRPYDEEKYRDGRVVEFNSLKELKFFYEEARNDIRYTDEHEASFNEWSWQVIDLDLSIDESEDNLMILGISAHDEWQEQFYKKEEKNDQ